MSTQAIEAGLVTAAASEVAKHAQDFIAAAAGRPGETIGTILAGWTQLRIKNVESIGNKAHLTLLKLELKPKEVPFNVIQPLLESATLQGEPRLQDTWANLLANAADPRRERPVNAIFPYILRDLGPAEVRLLHTLYTESERRLSGHIAFHRLSHIMYHQGDLMEMAFNLGLVTAPIHHPTFEVQQRTDYSPSQDAFFLMLDLIRHHDVIRETVLPANAIVPGFKDGERVYHFTELGSAFVLACRPPAK